MAFWWGFSRFRPFKQHDSDALFLHAVDCAKQVDLVSPGDTVVITAGLPLNISGTTNILRLMTVEENK